MSKKISVSKAIGEAIHEEMVRDQNVIVLGEDMGKMGNVFGITVGFQEEFGAHRVWDTPISESGFCGMAVGAAMRGMRPVVELMYNDFITVAADPILNQAAKMRYMTGGQASVPMVLRCPMGAGRRNAGQHSQCLEALFCHTPGLKVIAPSSAEDAKGLLKAAIRDDDPVICMEHKLLYAKKEEIPEGEYIIPLGQAKVKREGTDLTVITWSREVYFALEAAEELAKEGINIEVLDLRTLVPLDWDAIVKSVSKTHNVIVLSEEVKRGSYAAEISAQ
ncbi:alpha-ketoacid dehydrogenase subunit beta, partial [Anaerotignum faecicola]